MTHQEPTDHQKDQAFKHLFNLQEQGSMNMFEGDRTLVRIFPWSEDTARMVLYDWMNNYGKIKERLQSDLIVNDLTLTPKGKTRLLITSNTKVGRVFLEYEMGTPLPSNPSLRRDQVQHFLDSATRCDVSVEILENK